mgnify:CR=1 FL=1
MILHASVPADEPERVARVIAELWNGEAVPFPPVERTWMAIAHDGRGCEIEVSPRDLAFLPGPAEIACAAQPETPRHSSSHLLVAPPLVRQRRRAASGARSGRARAGRRGCAVAAGRTRWAST